MVEFDKVARTPYNLPGGGVVLGRGTLGPPPPPGQSRSILEVVMRVEVRVEDVGDLRNCIARGRAGSKRVYKRADGVSPKDVAATLDRLHREVRAELTVEDVRAD